MLVAPYSLMEIPFFHQTEMVSLLCAMNHCRVPFHSSPTLDVQPLPCLIWNSFHGQETCEISISCEMPWIMMFLMAMVHFFPRYLLGVQVATNVKSTNLSGLPQFSDMISKAYASKTALKIAKAWRTPHLRYLDVLLGLTKWWTKPMDFPKSPQA